MADPLLEFIKNAWESDGRVMTKFSIGDLLEQEIAQLSILVGFSLKGFSRTIDSFGARHVGKKHGDHAAESARGQVAVTPEDFLLVIFIVKDYDTLVQEINKLGNTVLRYEKEIDNCRWYYLEEIRTGRKEIVLQTLYKRKIRR